MEAQPFCCYTESNALRVYNFCHVQILKICMGFITEFTLSKGEGKWKQSPGEKASLWLLSETETRRKISTCILMCWIKLIMCLYTFWVYLLSSHPPSTLLKHFTSSKPDRYNWENDCPKLMPRPLCSPWIHLATACGSSADGWCWFIGKSAHGISKSRSWSGCPPAQSIGSSLNSRFLPWLCF